LTASDHVPEPRRPPPFAIAWLIGAVACMPACETGTGADERRVSDNAARDRQWFAQREGYGIRSKYETPVPPVQDYR